MKKSRGELAIDGSISFLVICALIALSITVFTTINKITALNTTANELARYIEIRGSTNGAFTELERLCAATGIVTTVDIVGDVKRGKIQQGTPFTLVLKSQAHIGVGGIFKIPIPIQAKATGRGEKLWK